MDSRTLLALVLSIAVLVGFQFFFGGDVSQPPREETGVENVPATGVSEQASDHEYGERIRTDGGAVVSSAPLRKARDITVETDLYQLVFSEKGGTVKKYLLKQYLTTLSGDAPPVNLIDVSPQHLPLGLKMESQPPVLPGGLDKAPDDILDSPDDFALEEENNQDEDKDYSKDTIIEHYHIAKNMKPIQILAVL